MLTHFSTTLRLRRRLATSLVVFLVCASALGQQAAKLPARQPSYPTPAVLKANADATSITRLGTIKQKLSALPKSFQKPADRDSRNATNDRRVVSPRSKGTQSADTMKRGPLAVLKETIREAFPPRQPRQKPAAQRVTRPDQKVRVLQPPPSRRSQPRTSYAGHSQRIKTRKSQFPPPITFRSSNRSPTDGIARSPTATARVSHIANQSNSPSTNKQRPVFGNGNRRQERIEWASGVDETPPLPAGSPTDDGIAPRKAPRTIDVPLNDAALDGRIQISTHNGRISLIVREAPLESVLELIAQQQGLNIVTAGSASVAVSATLTDVDLDDALSSILSVSGYTWSRQKDIIVVSPIVGGNAVAPNVQGRVVRVFPLNFVSATDVQQTITGLLSPAGQSFLSESDPTNKRRTRDTLVVEDLPDYLRRVEEYIAQIDQPPRQVLIEAHILRVDLTDETRHGVDFNYVAQLANTQLSLRTQGFTNPAASPAFFLGIDGTDIDALVEAIKVTSDAKTLASPKILVVNGQEARIQIGERFGYLVTTTTETSTLQNVDFLDVGVVMSVTPQISDDGQVLMSVRPEVSSGRINILTGLPEEETTEVNSTVMLPDGHGIVIGGLIQETDADRQSKIPILGDLWLIGRLFQRRSVVRERSEIIIALVPRIVPYGVDYDIQAETEFIRASTPLLDGELWKTDRPWEAVMPDAVRNPRRVRVRRIPDVIPNLFDPAPNPVEYYFATQPEYESWIPPFVSIDDDDLERAGSLDGEVIIPQHPYDE